MTTILAATPYFQYFDVSLTLYKYYIKQAQYTNVELNISGVDTKAIESLSKGDFTNDIGYKN